MSINQLMRVNLFFGNKIKFERYDRENEFNNCYFKNVEFSF